MKVSKHIVEEWLILHCQRGGPKAFELLIKRWHPRIVSRIYYTIGDANAAEDIAQETWITILQKIKTLRDPGAFEWWSLRIATGKAIDWLRAKQTSRKREEVRKAAQEEFSEPTNNGKEEILDALRDAIYDLPEDQQRVIRMFYQEDLSIHAISKILGCPEGTVKSRLFKSREKLKKMLKTKMIRS